MPLTPLYWMAEFDPQRTPQERAAVRLPQFSSFRWPGTAGVTSNRVSVVDRSRAREKRRESCLSSSSSWLPSSFQPGFSDLPVLSSRWIPLIVLHSLAIPTLSSPTPIPHRAEGEGGEVSTPNHSHPPHPTRTKPIPRRGTLSTPRYRCYSYPLHDNDGNQTLRKDFRKFSRLFVGSRGGGGGRHKHRSPRRPRTHGSCVIALSSLSLSLTSSSPPCPSIRLVTLSYMAGNRANIYPNPLSLFNNFTWNVTHRLAR